jgi:DNA-binding NarL/FixJ family response regulator
VIRMLMVDDHPALRAGLNAVLQAEPGFVPVDAVAGEQELWPAIHRARPDVVLLDYHLQGRDGLALCRQVKRLTLPPAVLLYSAYADTTLSVAAALAGADGMVNKGIPARELYDAIRTVAAGRRLVPQPSAELMEAVADRVDPADMPIVRLVLYGEDPDAVAGALQLEPDDVSARIDALIARLKVEVAGR